MPAAFAIASGASMHHFAKTHLSVMKDEVRALLAPALESGLDSRGVGRVALDCTFGRGGHSQALLETGALVIALDQDSEALALNDRPELRDHPRLRLRHANFRQARAVLDAEGISQVDALLVDLGVSSPQLDTASRGFSFRAPGPLDMRMDPSCGVPLSERLATVDAEELASVLWRFGEERRSRAVARAILKARDEERLNDTRELAAAIESQLRDKRGGVHPATRSFQALRIWVNDELGALQSLLDSLASLIAPSGRALFLSFHSLEDRPVKEKLRELSTGCICPPEFPVCSCGKVAWGKLIGRGDKKAKANEIDRNPRSRSARLRAIQRLQAGPPSLPTKGGRA